VADLMNQFRPQSGSSLSASFPEHLETPKTSPVIAILIFCLVLHEFLTVHDWVKICMKNFTAELDIRGEKIYKSNKRETFTSVHLLTKWDTWANSCAVLALVSSDWHRRPVLETLGERSLTGSKSATEIRRLSESSLGVSTGLGGEYDELLAVTEFVYNEVSNFCERCFFLQESWHELLAEPTCS
jgi:hypothetical protein